MGQVFGSVTDWQHHPRLLTVLKIMTDSERTSQKAIAMDALTAYLSQKQDIAARG